MLSRVMALPRRLLNRGAAGDAAAAGGRDIGSNAALQLGARVFAMAVSVVTAALTARTLGPDGFGVFVGMTAYVGLFVGLSDLGFMLIGTQRMAAEPERESEWLGALAGARCSLAVVMTGLCAASIPLFLDDVHHQHLVGLILTGTILLTGPQTFMAVFHARLRSGVILFFAVVQGFLWLGAVLVLATTGASVVAFAAANVAVLTVIGALQVRLTRRAVRIAWASGRKLWRPLIRAALPVGLASLMITVYYQVDSVLLLQIAGAGEAGVYGAAYRFIGPLSFLPLAVMSSVLPVVSAVHGRDPHRVRRLVQVSAESMGIISLPILAGAIALSGPIVAILFGEEFERAAALLPILMIAFVWLCFGTLAGVLAPALGLQWRLALVATVGAAVNVLLNLLLIPRYGAFGAAWATVATEGLTMAFMFSAVLVKLRLRLALGRLMRTAGLAAIATGAMAFVAPLGLILAAGAGALLYLAGLIVLRIIDVDELRRLRASPS
jgi:PST family polysaccharide transporter